MQLRESQNDTETAGPQQQQQEPTSQHANAHAHAEAGAAAVNRMAGSQKEPYEPGTELYVHRKLGYHHSGIYVGNGEVVQVHGEPGSVLKALTHLGTSFDTFIDKVPLATFAKGENVTIGPNGCSQPPSIAINRALSKVGSAWKYNALTHNCQHFTSWCETGKEDSPEADAIENAWKKAEGEPGKILGGIEHAVGGLFSHL